MDDVERRFAGDGGLGRGHVAITGCTDNDFMGAFREGGGEVGVCVEPFGHFVAIDQDRGGRHRQTGQAISETELKGDVTGPGGLGQEGSQGYTRQIFKSDEQGCDSVQGDTPRQ